MSSQARVQSLRSNRFRLDLDLPAFVEEAFDDTNGARRQGLAHDVAVRASDRVAISGIRHEHAGAHDVIHRSSGFAESGRDDLETPPGLDVRIRVDRPVWPDRRGARHDNPVADANRAAEPNRLLECRPGAVPTAIALQGLRVGGKEAAPAARTDPGLRCEAR